jgi:hypothetical protein
VTVRFAANNIEAAVLLPLLPNTETAPDRTILLTLTNANLEISLAGESAAVLTILGPATRHTL